MGKPNFGAEFKRDAVAQITERGYPVAEVLQRLGGSPHSLSAWKRQLAKVVSGDPGKGAEIRQLKRELAWVTEERDILKKHRVFRSRCKVSYAFIAKIAIALACEQCAAASPCGPEVSMLGKKAR